MTAARERLAVIVVIGLVARIASADGSEADTAFKKGRELLKDGKYAEACEQFERSQQLDPALGTLFNIAQCDEHIGKLASAIAAYREVVSRDTKAERRAAANDLAQKLEPRVPKLVVKVPPTARNAAVLVDGKHAFQANTPIEVDNGSHTVEVRADGMKAFTTSATIADEGKTVTVTATLVPGTDPTPPAGTGSAVEPKQHEPVDTGEEHSPRKKYAIGALAAGGAMVITGAVYGALASSKWKDAKAVCGGQTCATQTLADQASQIGDDARSKANISTVLFAVGGVAATVGVVLWLTAPSESPAAQHTLAVSARASSNAGAVVLSGQF